MSLLNRPINLTVLSTTKSTVSREVITAGDSGAYPLTITFSDVDAITGGVKFHFVRGDDYWDRDASDGIAISGNSVSYMLEPVLYAKPGLTLWVSFDNSNLFTPLQVTFNNIRTIPGTVEAATTQPYPQWAADMRAFDVSIGTVETLAEGEDATASVTGDVPNKTLNLGIPVGATGATGEKGNTGEIAVGTVTTLAAGADATVTNTGTSTDAVLDFGIPQGIQGDAATVEVGTVTTVSPSTPASVTNVGTASEAVLNFSIPKGDTGAAGTINETTESTLDGILAADGSTVAVASAAQAAAQAITDPGDLYTADTLGGQLQEVKALSDGKADASDVADTFSDYALWKTTAPANPVTVYPVPESPMFPKVAGTFVQSGTGDPSPSNIRPIAPWLASGATVNVAITDGGDTDITAPQEIPAGWMDNEGHGQVTWTKRVLTGTEPWGYGGGYFGYGALLYADIPNRDASISTHAPYVVSPDADYMCFWIDTSGMSLRLRNPDYTTKEEFSAYLSAQYAAGAPLTIYYPLAAPIAITPTEVAPLTALTQTNRVTPRQNVVTATPAASVELTYAKSPIQESIDIAAAIAG